jgi:hypothetical protein
MKITDLWAVIPDSSQTAQRFGEIYRLHLQGKKVIQARNQQKHVAS